MSRVYTGDCFRTPHIRSVTCASRSEDSLHQPSSRMRNERGRETWELVDAPVARLARSRSARSRAVVA